MVILQLLADHSFHANITSAAKLEYIILDEKWAPDLLLFIPSKNLGFFGIPLYFQMLLYFSVLQVEA